MTGTKSKLCYGVDVSADACVVVRSTRKGKRIEHRVCTEDALSTLRGETRGGRATVAAAMHVRDSFTRWLKTPFTSKAKARRVLPTLLDIQLPFPLESCLYDFLELTRTSEGEIDALAVAARRDGVETCLQHYAQAGIQPDRLDHEGLALWTQSVEELPLERGGRRVVAYLGHAHSAISIGDHRGFKISHSVKFAYPKQESTASFTTRCRQALRAQFPENGETPIQWIWTGPGANEISITQSLEHALRADIDLTFSKHRDSESFLARAVATRALTQGPLRCNLMQDTLASPERTAQKERAAQRTALAYAATGLLLCFLNLGWAFYLDHRNDRAQDRIAALAAELTGSTYSPSWRGQEVLIVERSMPERMVRIEPFSFAFGPSLTAPLSRLLVTARRTDMALDKLAVEADRVLVEGSANDWDSCNVLAETLRDLGFEAVLNRSDALADERVHFTLEGAPAS